MHYKDSFLTVDTHDQGDGGFSLIVDYRTLLKNITSPEEREEPEENKDPSVGVDIYILLY